MSLCFPVGALWAVWHLDPLSESACDKGCRFTLSCNPADLMNRLVVLDSTSFIQACRGDALSLLILLPGTMEGPWLNGPWVVEGGLRWRAKNSTRSCPMALGQSLSELCCQLHDLFRARLARGGRCSWTCNAAEMQWSGGVRV